MQRINNFFSYIKAKKVKVKECFGEDIKFIPVEIIFSSNIKKLNTRINKAKSILKKYSVSDILFTDEIKEILNEKHYCGIPKGSLVKIFNLLYNKLSIDKCKMIYLYDRDLSFFNYHNAEQIIYIAERIILCTENIYLAKDITEKLFYEYGVCIDIKKYSLNNDNKKFIIDADRGIIRIGDVFADGVEYDIECEKYNLDLRPLADNLDFSDKMKIKNIVSGKNLIKLVDN